MRKTQGAGALDTVAGVLTVGGQERTYTAVLPAAPVPEGVTLLLVLHGSNQTGAKVRTMAGGSFDAHAAAGNAVVVYPDAYRGLWHDARSSLSSPAKRAGIDDVAFLTELAATLGARFGTDRAVGAGYSNGGQMVIRLVHEAPGLLAAAGIIAATMPTPDVFAAADRYRPLPVTLFHGTRDPLVPYAGGPASLWGLRPRGTGLSALDTARYFAVRNGITTEPATTDLPRHDPKTSTTVTTWAEPGRPAVTLHTVTGGGHTIPNPTRNALFILGRTTHDFTAADVVHDSAPVR